MGIITTNNSFKGSNQYPSHGNWATGKGIAWIKLELNKIEKQSTLGRGTGQIALTKMGVDYKFMAPNEIMEVIQHQWEDYDSMNAKGGNLIVSASQAVTDLMSTTKALGESVIGAFKTRGINANTFVDNMKNSYTGGTVFSGAKQDTPIVYKNSARREYTLEFELVTYYDSYSDVYKPVEELRYYSCPGLKADSLSFDLPYVFKVTSGSAENESNFLYMEVAALVSIQPTFKGPYQNGYPTHCNLQLTLREVPPLFRENFYIENAGYATDSTSKLITTSTNEQADAARNSVQNIPLFGPKE